MKLDDLTGGRIYVDTNILYMYLRADPLNLPMIRSFLNHVADGEIEAYVGVPVIDELVYRLLLAKIRDNSGRNPLDVLRDDLAGAIESYGMLIQTAVQQLLALPNIHTIGVEVVDGDSMLTCLNRYKLLPRDALHVAIMQRLGIDMIASDDTDFDRVDGLERFWVMKR